MSEEQMQECLSLDDSENSFSGFSCSDMEDEVPAKNGPAVSKVKSVVVKPSTSKQKASKSSQKKSTGKTVISKKSRPEVGKKLNKKNDEHFQSSILDVSKLSEKDLCSLREALGIQTQSQTAVEFDRNEEYESLSPLQTLENLPNIRVELDSNDVSDGETINNPYVSRDVGEGMTQALFGEQVYDENTEECSWSLPTLKVPKKGEVIGQALADMINVACTTQCEVEQIVSKFSVPKNCDKACAPLVNNEIWKVMDKRSQTLDRGLVDIQNLVTSGITPIIKLADVMKKELSKNPEAQTLLSDALVIMGQVQYLLSVKRRYNIRPSLKKKYQSLCSMSMPITTKLFGDDVSKDIKACDSMCFIGREQRFPSFRGGRGNPRFARRQYGNYGGFSGQRFQPYPPRGQRAGYRIPRRSAPATSTCPNPN